MADCEFASEWWYCNRRYFRAQLNFVYFILLAESTKVSSIRKSWTHKIVCGTVLAVRKFNAYESSRTFECETFLRVRKFLRLQYLILNDNTVEFCSQASPSISPWLCQRLFSVRVYARPQAYTWIWIPYGTIGWFLFGHFVVFVIEIGPLFAHFHILVVSLTRVSSSICYVL